MTNQIVFDFPKFSLDGSRQDSNGSVIIPYISYENVNECVLSITNLIDENIKDKYFIDKIIRDTYAYITNETNKIQFIIDLYDNKTKIFRAQIKRTYPTDVKELYKSKAETKLYKPIETEKMALKDYISNHHDIVDAFIELRIKEFKAQNLNDFPDVLKTKITEMFACRLQYTCICGSIVRKPNKCRHEETKKHLDFINRKAPIQEVEKSLEEINEEIKDRKLFERERQKQYLKKYRSVEVTCECGGKYHKQHKLRHESTDKHINYFKTINFCL